MNPFPRHDGISTGSNLADLVQVMAAAEFITDMLLLCLEHSMTFPILKLIDRILSTPPPQCSLACGEGGDVDTLV